MRASSLEEAFCSDYASARHSYFSSAYEYTKAFNYCLRNSQQLIREYERRKVDGERRMQQLLEDSKREAQERQERQEREQQRLINHAVENIDSDFR